MSDPTDYACRLIRKATARRLRVLLCAEPDELARVDQALWVPQLGFMAHAIQTSPEHVRARSPVYLCRDVLPADTADVFINMQAGVPAYLEHFGRLIEIVPPDEALRAKARQRWRHFTTLGWTPEGFDAAA
ncbi:MAG: DNA polymerase III subunit chi [Burkholderiales bacterium]|nr:DNA polymerase III subunit chi [Burkholderiales bacterium]